MLREAFIARFHARFGIALAGMQVMLLNLRTSAFGRREQLDLHVFAPHPGKAAPPRTTAGSGSAMAGTTRRSTTARVCPPGAELHGPAVIEQSDTTVLLHPSSHATVDALGNLVVTP